MAKLGWRGTYAKSGHKCGGWKFVKTLPICGKDMYECGACGSIRLYSATEGKPSILAKIDWRKT